MSAKTIDETGLYLRGATWWIRYRDPSGREIRESAKTNDGGQAQKLRAARLRDVANHREGIRRFQGPASERLTVGALLDNLERDHETRRLKSLRQTKVHLRLLRTAFGTLRAIRITTRTIEDYIGARRAEKMADATIDRETELLRRSFTPAAHAEPPLVAWVPRVPRLVKKGANAREGFVDRADFEKLVDELPSEVLQDVARWGYFIGMRLGEVKSLTWEGYDRETRTMRLPGKNAKSGRARMIVLDGMPELAELIDRRLATRRLDCPLVFHNGQGRRVGEFYTTDLRRTAVRNMIRAGVDRDVAKRISGHETDEIFTRYNIVNEKDLAEAMVKRAAYEQTLPTAAETPALCDSKTGS
jgi:integrase